MTKKVRKKESRNLIGIDIPYPYSKFKKSQQPFSRKLTKCQFQGKIGPKKGSERGTQCINRHGTFTIRQILMSPFLMQRIKKLQAPILKKLTKLIFVTYRCTYIQTRVSYRTFAFGGPKLNFINTYTRNLSRDCKIFLDLWQYSLRV